MCAEAPTQIESGWSRVSKTSSETGGGEKKNIKKERKEEKTSGSLHSIRASAANIADRFVQFINYDK